MGLNKSECEEFENEIPLKNMARIEEGSEQQPEDADGITRDNRRKKRNVNRRKLLIYLVVTFLAITVVILVVYFLLKHISQEYSTEVHNTGGGGLVVPNCVEPLPPSASVLHVFRNGAVCSDSDVCSDIGRDIFLRGGNAVDSALATLFCNGIATMQSMGFGGGFIMNVYIRRENKSYTIDAREVAPLAASQDMFLNKTKTASMVGPLAIAVPGEVMGYWEAHNRFASMTWKEIIEPSIKVCQDGIILSKHMWDALHTNPRIKNDTHLNSTFVNQTTGEFYRVGTRVYPQKELCETYKQIMIKGGMDFYNGTIAKMIVEDLRDIGSIITAEDLESYHVNWQYSAHVPLNKDMLHVAPPVGSGLILAFILNVLRGYNMTQKNLETPEEAALTYHRFIEAYKFAFAKRYELGDSRFINVTELSYKLRSSLYAEGIRKLIDDTKTFNDNDHYHLKFISKTQTGTSHISILAQNGDAVSVTSSVNFYFGCGHTGRRTGIIFNSGMDDFSSPGINNFFGIPGAEPNYIRPQKRAMSSMCPTIITDQNGDVKLVIGAAGGTKIITSVAWVIARSLWFGEDIKQAIDAPRIHHQLVPNEVQYEYGVLQSIVDGLAARGHKLVRYQERGSTMCGIAKNETAVYANADYRKKGDVSGL